MVKCSLININNRVRIQYFFETLPRVGESIMIDGVTLLNNEDWQEFAGVVESDPLFERLTIRSFQVTSINHWISENNRTHIEVYVDELYGEKED